MIRATRKFGILNTVKDQLLYTEGDVSSKEPETFQIDYYANPKTIYKHVRGGYESKFKKAVAGGGVMGDEYIKPCNEAEIEMLEEMGKIGSGWIDTIGGKPKAPTPPPVPVPSGDNAPTLDDAPDAPNPDNGADANAPIL